MTGKEMMDFLSQVMESVPSEWDTVAILNEERIANTRFGQNRVTQNSDKFTRRLILNAGRDNKKAIVSTFRIDSEVLPELVDRIKTMLDTAPVDPEYMPPVPGGQVYPVVNCFDPVIAEAPVEKRMNAVQEAIETAKSKGLEAAGTCEMNLDRIALATSAGNMVFHERTQGIFEVTLDGNGGSSYRSEIENSWDRINAEKIVKRVSEEAVSSANPRDLPHRGIDYVLEPEAVSNLIPYIVYMLNAREADEGLTAFTDKLDKKITGDNFTMYSDITGPVPGIPFDNEGLPSCNIQWIKNGVLKSYLCERYWAEKTGRKPVSQPGCYYINGDSGQVMDLIADVKQGVLIRRLWYIRFIDQKELSLTGMTRDGVFWIEDGKIKFPVKDFRWNEHLLSLFSRIEKLGEPVRKGRFMVPPALIRKK